MYMTREDSYTNFVFKVYANEERPQPLDGALVRVRGPVAFSFEPSHPTPAFHTRVARTKTKFSPETRLCSWHNGLMPTRVRSADTERSAGVVLDDLGVTSTCSSTVRLLFLFFTVCFVSVSFFVRHQQSHLCGISGN